METAPLATKLTSKVISSGKGSSYTVPNSAEQCADARDALAKQVYVHLFDWLIERLNVALAGEGEDLNDDENFVGLLDIFGFENFKFNSFEQLEEQGGEGGGARGDGAPRRQPREAHADYDAPRLLRGAVVLCTRRGGIEWC